MTTISFGGASIKRPGAYSQVDTETMTPVVAGAFNVLAFIGVVGSGSTLTANTVSFFNSPSDARAAVGASELLDCMSIAWAHGADLLAVVPVAVTDPATAPTDTQWQAAIDALEAEFVDGIVPVTVTPAIHAKVDAHVTNMSSVVNRRERRAFYGHEVGMDKTAILALQTALNGERGMMATPTVFYPDATGALVEKGSHYLAAAYAGLWAGQNPQEPITNKFVKFAKLGKVYNGTDITDFTDGHIAPVEAVRGQGFRIVHGVTLSASEDLSEVELSVSTLKDVMSKRLRDHYEKNYVGKAGVKGIEVTMHNDAITLLDQFVKDGWLTAYDPTSVKITKNGTAFYFEAQGDPTLPINNFFITSHYKLK